MNQNILAKPSSTCCLRGSRHVGSPKGTIQQLGGIDTYISTPEIASEGSGASGNELEKVLLYFPDAFGLYENAFLMMDAFAEQGWIVLGCDYFGGDSVGKHTTSPLNDPSFDFEAWTQNHLHSSERIAESWIQAVVAEYGKNTKFACVGYCWGARFVCRQLSEQGVCSVGAIAHPSFLSERDMAGVKAPLYIVAPSEDELFPPELRNRTQEILAKGKAQFSMQVYSGVGHGFATRANLEDPHAKWAKERCFKNFVDWFDHWLSRD